MTDSMNSYKCVRCKDSGMVLDVIDGLEVAVSCPVCGGIKGKQIRNLRASANIPESYKNCYFEDIDWNAWKDESGNPVDMSKKQKIIQGMIEDYESAKERGVGIYLYSDKKGTGKTFISSIICNELMERYQASTYYARCSDLIDIEKSANKDGTGKYEREPIARLREVDVLVLDDIGVQAIEGWIYNILFKILDTRMNNNKITIFTSNVPCELLGNDRIIRRVIERTFQIQLPEHNVSNKTSRDWKAELLKKWLET